MVGFGSIGQGVLPLLLRHIGVKPEQIEIVTGDDRGQALAAEQGVKFSIAPLTPETYTEVISSRVKKGDFIVNLSVDVSSVDMLKLAHKLGALYLDTVVEPWLGGYSDPNLTMAQRTNYALREEMLATRAQLGAGPTAVVTHGANPGLVSHFVKQAMLNIAKDTGQGVDVPKTKAEWAALAQKLGVKVIHIAERDTQVAAEPKKPGEFINTWSIDGFYSEGCQPAELGWGSHEKHFPADGHRQEQGRKSAIFLARPGAGTRVRTWTPMEGPFHGFLVTHGESVSLSDFFTVGEGHEPAYRPTVHYAYHPCDGAVLSLHELAGKNWEFQKEHRLIVLDVVEGVDELGVLLCGHEKGAYWFGSQLSMAETVKLVPHNNATSLQVTAAVLAGVIWAMENPSRGIVEPEELDHARILEIAGPYLGLVIGEYTDWTPLQDRGTLFPEDLDTSDPWQFKNIRVI